MELGQLVSESRPSEQWQHVYCGRRSKVCPQGPLNWNHADGAHWPTQWLVVMWHDIWRLDSASPAVSPRCCCRACPQGRIHVILKEVCLYLFCYQCYSSQMKRQFKHFRYCSTTLRFSLAGVIDIRFLRSDAFCFPEGCAVFCWHECTFVGEGLPEGITFCLVEWMQFSLQKYPLLFGRRDALSVWQNGWTFVWQKGCTFVLQKRCTFILQKRHSINRKVGTFQESLMLL